MADEAKPFEADEVHASDRSCPVCGARMQVEKKKPVSIDVCAAHGIWLDHGELDQITDRLRNRLRQPWRPGQAEALERARRDGVVCGALWGWLALLFDRR
jgi:Zn-finger nucleic acid-binding protein